ncbi:MAG TPA: glycerophosphodiester phosphodiesterase family protein [Xanthobacteraceae bacterium]|jgi:glycerophosphoryl diester phosphodiesterase|nr:glycerophosphodiester phosphodiesterase family protein [Xanthobacteraceae bacterium]
MSAAGAAPWPVWLIARPIAHRGLHDAARGIIENTAGAIDAAIAGRYGIEVDLQISSDGEAMVHHDDALGRLTDGDGRLAEMSAAELKRVPFRASAERMLTLPELLERVGGRVALVLELKSRFDGDDRLVARVAKTLAAYAGPVAAMSFDPVMIAALRRIAPRLRRGIVAERRFAELPPRSAAWRRPALAHLLHAPMTRPDFVAYRVDDLPAPATRVARLLGLPILTWTVRTAAQRQQAASAADQMIFEGFRP